MEERLRPFIERTHSILGAATSADYNNNVRDSQMDYNVIWLKRFFIIIMIINVPFDQIYTIYIYILDQIRAVFILTFVSRTQ